MIKNKITSFETESDDNVAVKTINNGKCELIINSVSICLSEEEAEELSSMLFNAFENNEEDKEEYELPGKENVDAFMNSLQEMIDNYHDGCK